MLSAGIGVADKQTEDWLRFLIYALPSAEIGVADVHTLGTFTISDLRAQASARVGVTFTLSDLRARRSVECAKTEGFYDF